MVVIEKQRIIRRGGPCVLPQKNVNFAVNSPCFAVFVPLGRTQGPPLRRILNSTISAHNFRFIELFNMRRSVLDRRSILARQRYPAGDLIAQFIELLKCK